MQAERAPEDMFRLTDLMQDLWKHTPNDHPDYDKLTLVLPKMEQVANHINNEKSKFDNLTVIHSLSNMISGYDDVSILLYLISLALDKWSRHWELFGYGTDIIILSYHHFWNSHFWSLEDDSWRKGSCINTAMIQRQNRDTFSYSQI